MSTTAADKTKNQVITITVNRKPVDLPEKHVTGLAIKEAAIAQGVAIQLDFQLSEKKGQKFRPIADTDTVTVKTGDEFRAVTGEDNS
ncbi:multiubiquitin domain-containing protein [Microbacterium sulfonylureivorans]|uniref:multiubiquitin domain-containing protein n=1 Tax=Microbacterium sulfonylureivorans TaxID=2486854 RepID=UPI000FD97F3C|nr:multiubiquitin domain-containing protein [Microbacterium sulfonylureivorans]